MRYHNVPTTVAVVAALLLPLNGFAAGQNTEKPVASFSGTVDVNVVSLFVSAVDGNGQPVTGLSADDFSVVEDGQPRQITNFSAWLEGRLADANLASGSALPAADAAEEPVSLAILFDLTSLSPHDRRRVQEALDGFFEMERNAEVMVAAATPDLRIIRPFTTDLAAARVAVHDIAKLDVGGAATIQSRRLLVADIRRSPVRAPDARRLQWRIESFRNQELTRIDTALTSLQQLAQAMSGRPGRKVVVWVGEDLAMLPAVDLYRQFYAAFARLQRDLSLDPPEIWGRQLDLTDRFKSAVGNTQATGVTVFSVDARDRDGEQLEAYTGVGDVSTRIASESGGAAIGAHQLANALDALAGADYLARATGGQLFSNSRNFDRFFSDLDQQLDAVYFIGYSRPVAADGELHTIDVKVDRPGVTVRHHEKVLDRTDDQRLVDLLTSRLLLGAGSNSLDLQLEAAATKATENQHMVLPLYVTLPTSRLGVIPGDQSTVELTLACRALAGEGAMSAPMVRRVALTLPRRDSGAEVLTGTTLELEIAPDTTAIAVAVRDHSSGVESTTRLLLRE